MRLLDKLVENYWPSANGDDPETWDSVIRGSYAAGFEAALKLAAAKVLVATGQNPRYYGLQFMAGLELLSKDVAEIGQEEV